MGSLETAKFWLVTTLGLSKDALHVYVGLIVFFAAALVFRLPLRDVRPLAAVLLAAVAGEVWDIQEAAGLGRVQHLADNWHDIWNTMFWPTAIFLLARYTPALRR